MIVLRRRLVLCRVMVRTPDPAKQPARSAGGCALRMATLDELLRAAREPELGLNAHDVRIALQRGELCVAAFDGERMIGYVWRALMPTRWAPHVWVEFSKPYRYGRKGMTLADYRGRHIANALSLFMDRYCLDQGYLHIISMIETHNFSSIEATKYRPRTFVGFAGYLTWRGRHYPFRTPGVRRHNFRLRYVADEQAMLDARPSVDVPDKRVALAR
jgi:hypothetical protein